MEHESAKKEQLSVSQTLERFLEPPDAPSKKRHPSLVVHYLERSERILLSLIAVVLVVLALLLLMNGVKDTIFAVTGDPTATPPTPPDLRGKAVDILDTVLLVMMTMEIVYTVTLSLQSHKLVAEPFLIIGIIAAIRRTLVITATSTSPGTPAFNSTLLELALLALIVGVMAAAIWIMRRSSVYVKEDETVLADD